MKLQLGIPMSIKKYAIVNGKEIAYLINDFCS